MVLDGGLVLLLAPFRSRSREEAEDLVRAKGVALMRGYVPIFAPDLLHDVLDDEDPAERRVALWASGVLALALSRAAGAAGVRLCRVGERATEGMCSDWRAWHVGGADVSEAVCAVQVSRLPTVDDLPYRATAL